MQRSYIYNIAYQITDAKIHTDGTADHPPKDIGYQQMLKIRHQMGQPDLIITNLTRLKNEATDIFNIKGTPAERKAHYKACWDIDGIKKVCLKYNLQPFAHLVITVDHQLSATEEQTLNEAVESQMIDGYGENPLHLCDFQGHRYCIEL